MSKFSDAPLMDQARAPVEAAVQAYAGPGAKFAEIALAAWNVIKNLSRTALRAVAESRVASAIAPLLPVILGTLGQDKAFNIHGATPQRIAAAEQQGKLGPGELADARAVSRATREREGTALSDSGGVPGRVTSATYTRDLGSVFKSLSNEGYQPTQINSAMNFARQMGTSEDMARKFVKLDQNNRDHLRNFVDDMRKKPTASEAELKEDIAKFRKEHPGIGKVMTDQDVLKAIRGKANNDVKLEGVQKGVQDKTQADRTAATSKLGIEKAVEVRHATTATKLAGNEKAAKEDFDVFGMAIDRAGVPKQTPAPPEVKPQKVEKPTAKRIASKVAAPPAAPG